MHRKWSTSTHGIAAATEETLRLWRESRRHLVKRRAGRTSLHAWRLCTRRLLALEALLAPRTSHASAGGLSDTLGPAFHASGRLRDAQVAILLLDELEARFPEVRRLVRHLRRELPRKRDEVTRQVRRLSYRSLRAGVEDWNPRKSTGTTRSIVARTSRRLARAENRLIGLLRRQPTDRQLHALRLQLKLIRYMMELCGTMRIGARPRWPLRTIQRMQESLGHVTDMAVLRRIVDGFASRHAGWHTKSAGLRRHLVGKQDQLRQRVLRSITRVLQ